jgi:hypothetical protein
MTGYMFIIGSCFSCGRRFTFNPDHVPSISINHETGKVDHANGVREPICLTCVERVNPLREANGLPVIIVHPDAYEPQEVA